MSEVIKGAGSQRTSCATCGAPLRRHPSNLKPRNYCDLKCRDADPNRPKRRLRTRGTRRSPWVTKPCAYCGRPVERRLTDSRPRHFCDRSCGSKQTRREGRPGRPRTERRAINGGGYVSIYVGQDHPMADARGHVAEHRFVMAGMIGRPLLPHENVHHKNGQRQDNRPKNLELWVKTQPQGQRAIDLLAWAREIIATYEPIEGAVT